jgi:hypothetical protein
MIFDACRSVTWESGRGLGPGNLEFLGPKWHSPIGSMPFHMSQKSPNFQGPTPPHLPKWLICLHQKHYVQGRISIGGPQVVLCAWASKAHSTALGESEVNLNHKTYYKSTGNCNVHKGTLRYIKYYTVYCTLWPLDLKRWRVGVSTCTTRSHSVRHVTGTGTGLLGEIPRVVVQKSALYKGPL